MRLNLTLFVFGIISAAMMASILGMKVAIGKISLALALMAILFGVAGLLGCLFEKAAVDESDSSTPTVLLTIVCVALLIANICLVAITDVLNFFIEQ